LVLNPECRSKNNDIVDNLNKVYLKIKNIFKRNQNKINAIQDPNKMKPPKRLRNPPKKGFQQKISTSKRQKTTPKRNGQTTAVPHGENIPIASDMEASHNDTRPTL
jgi:hypothetical protein